MNKDAIYCAQILAPLKYFNLKRKPENSKSANNAEQNFIERIFKKLTKVENGLVSSYYGKSFPCLGGFWDMINSGEFVFKYNGDKVVMHGSIYNSKNDWTEDLYETELMKKKRKKTIDQLNVLQNNQKAI